MDTTYDEVFKKVYRKLDQILRQAEKRRRKDDFEPYCDEFRPLNREEIRHVRRGYNRRVETHGIGSDTLVSYQAISWRVYNLQYYS